MSEPTPSFNWLEILDRPIAFHPIFVDLTGSVPAALILSQAFYWQRRTDDPDGWFYKSREEWHEETRLKRYDQEQARALLRKTPFWEESLRGIPARLYFRINLQALQNQLANKLADGLPTSRQTVCQQDGRTSPNKPADGLPTNSEITSEITSETTPEKDPPKPPKGGLPRTRKQKVSSDAQEVIEHLNAANDRQYTSAVQIQTLLNTGVSVADCHLVIDFGREVLQAERPEWYAQYFDNVTPFRPANFDKYHARAEEWERNGRPLLGTMSLLSPTTTKNIATMQWLIARRAQQGRTSNGQHEPELRSLPRSVGQDGGSLL
jgi:hypothetical protein